MTAGWRKVGPDPRLTLWANAARAAPAPTRAGGTWAVGLEALDNDAAGTVGGAPLPWDLFDLPRLPLHRAQLSAVYPGYPAREAGQSDAAFRFMQSRDNAHLDGLLPIGPEKRRYLREPHAFILGIALTPTRSAPLVVWQGSQNIIARAFAAADINGDLTKVYQAARAEVFATCPRVEVDLDIGQAVILHPMIIHGIAPWKGGDDPRVMAYFRPLCASTHDWLQL